MVVERVTDRQRVQHGAAFARRMMAAGREHALDVGVADDRLLQLHGGGEQFAGGAAGGDGQHDAVDMHARRALGLIDRMAQHLLGRHDVHDIAGLHALRLRVADAEHVDRMGAARQHILRRARFQPRDRAHDLAGADVQRANDRRALARDRLHLRGKPVRQIAHALSKRVQPLFPRQESENSARARGNQCEQSSAR